ncbi:MAG: carboxypeptidase-like regulatory domain-containing protein, partial [Acidobacteriota bacterium]|nr:carboxypeptidase-like regulatory domain-containing protein [Acidobacteriota bacterium]
MKNRLGEKNLTSPAAIVFLLCLLASGAFAQRATGTISGQVVSDGGQPIPHAKVSITGIGGISKILSGRMEIVTDEAGSFQADGLDPAPYSVSATAPGYVLLPDEKVGGMLGAGTTKYTHVGESVTIRMLRGGVITGRVTGATGEPIIGISIEVTRVRDENNRAAAAQMNINEMGMARQTDDRGVYRVYGLAPGAYVVSVGSGALGFSLKPTPFTGRMKIYHPSATTRDTATEVTVRSGEEAAGIDIRYRREPGFALSGKVTGAPANDQGAAAMTTSFVMLTKAGTDTVVATAIVLPIGDTSSYSFYGLPNGEYEATASRPSLKDASVMTSASRRVAINGRDITGIDLALVASASISGSVALEKLPTASVADGQKCEAGRESFLDEIVLRARMDDPNEKPSQRVALFGTPGVSVPNGKGEYAIGGLQAGRHFVEAQLPGEHWYVKSIVWTSAPAATPAARQVGSNGLTLKADDKLSGVQIVVAEGAASVKGKLTAPDAKGGKLPARVRVYLLPAEPDAKDDLLRFAEVKAEDDGSFNFMNLAPGKYLLTARAIPETESNDKPPKPVTWNPIERVKL